MLQLTPPDPLWLLLHRLFRDFRRCCLRVESMFRVETRPLPIPAQKGLGLEEDERRFPGGEAASQEQDEEMTSAGSARLLDWVWPAQRHEWWPTLFNSQSEFSDNN